MIDACGRLFLDSEECDILAHWSFLQIIEAMCLMLRYCSSFFSHIMSLVYQQSACCARGIFLLNLSLTKKKSVDGLSYRLYPRKDLRAVSLFKKNKQKKQKNPKTYQQWWNLSTYIYSSTLLEYNFEQPYLSIAASCIRSNVVHYVRI